MKFISKSWIQFFLAIVFLAALGFSAAWHWFQSQFSYDPPAGPECASHSPVSYYDFYVAGRAPTGPTSIYVDSQLVARFAPEPV